MENNNRTKKRVLITLDTEILEQLKTKNTKVSTLINNLLLNHLSLYSQPSSLKTHNPEVSGSNPLFVIKSRLEFSD
jgi:hypothetical protein